MARNRKVTLYRLATYEDGAHRYVPIKGGNKPAWGRNPESGKLGSYYIRYRDANGKRLYESLKSEHYGYALQELKARQTALNTPKSLTVISQKKTLRTEVHTFLADKPESWRYILGVFGDWYGWDKESINFQRSDFRAYAARVANLGLRPRTQKNYLTHVTEFLRNTGRIVIVVRNEQAATIAKLTSLIPSTLILVRSDFPKVNKKVKDYYARSVIVALFAARKTLRETLMLALFYFTGCRENEIAHLYWTDIRWEAKELLVREKQQHDWTTKTYEDRIVEIPDQLLEVLRQAYEKRTHKLILPNRDGHPDGHLLKKIQQIAKRGGITCGECRDCVERKGRNCQNFGLHKFRRTYARTLDEGKTPIEDIRIALGHKDVTTTVGYLGGGDKKQRQANIERSFPRTA